MRSLRQKEYREVFLKSPLWREIRLAVLDHYGDVCSVCGKSGGNDVHHKRYAKILGTEKMSDYQVLCRPCHEAHHAATRSRKKGKRKSKGVHGIAAYKSLTLGMKYRIMADCGLSENGLYLAMIDSGSVKPKKMAARLLGVPYIYTFKKKSVKSNKHVFRVYP